MGIVLTFVWHIFLVVWCTGVAGGSAYIWANRPSAKQDRLLKMQIAKTRLAELQARERRALDEFVCWYQFDPGAKKFIRGCTS